MMNTLFMSCVFPIVTERCHVILVNGADFRHISSAFGIQEEEEKSSSKASKAAQKRARKKAAANQAAGRAEAVVAEPPPPPPPAPAAPAAAAAAAAATGISQRQPHEGASCDPQTKGTEPSTSETAAAMQQLDLDAPEHRAASSPPAAPSGQQAADDWMVCPLTKVGGPAGQPHEKLAYVGFRTEDDVVSDVRKIVS